MLFAKIKFSQKFPKLQYEPGYGISILIEYVKTKPALNAPRNISSGTRDQTFGLGFHLHPNCIYVNSEDSGLFAQPRLNLRYWTMLQISTKISYFDSSIRVKSGNFGHRVNSNIHLQTVELQMRRLLTSRFIWIFSVCLVNLFLFQ